VAVIKKVMAAAVLVALAATLLAVVGCSNSGHYGTPSSDYKEEEVYESTIDANDEGLEDGYEAGYEAAGEGSYDDNESYWDVEAQDNGEYETEAAQSEYESGWEAGYQQGYEQYAEDAWENDMESR